MNALEWDYEDYAIRMGSGDIFEAVLKDYETLGIIGEEHNKLMCYLAATSRLMDTPLNILVLSSSGAGKSTLLDKTLKLMPPEDVVRASAITDKALYYMDSLNGKILALEEAAGIKDIYAIRTLISEGYLAQESVSGQRGKSNYVKGGCSVFQTTTNPQINPETKSRFFILGVDESREQTRRILEMQRKSHTLEGLKDNSESEGIIRKHHAFQRMLEPYPVVNPYAEELFYEDDRLQARRDQPKFLNLCKAVAFLNQMKKPLKNCNGVSYIEVDRSDIKQAMELASELLGISLDDLSLPARNLLDLLTKMGKQIFTRKDVMDFTGWTKTRLHIHLTELIEMELVLPESSKKGQPQTYKLLYHGEAEPPNSPAAENITSASSSSCHAHTGKRFLIGLRPI